MVDYTDKEYFLKNSIDKQLIIECEDGTVITNEILHSENFSLDEKLCNQTELTFGECIASIVKFRVSNIVHPLIAQWMTIKMVLNHNENSAFEIGRYKVASDTPTADRLWRDITAYDAMYDIINSDMADWYNTILPNADSTVTLKTFRSSFIQHFGLEQEEIELVNDNMVITKTIEPSEISGKDIISAICEINGCFGHIGRDNKFHYICLKQDISGLYPSDTLYPADNLYPKDPGSERIGKSYYMSCEYEDFVTKPITKLQIRKEENDIGCIYGEGDNTYIIQDNFLVYGMSAEELENVCRNLLPQISMVIYRPSKTEAKGNPCLEVGDAIRMSTRLELVETYILQRRLKGIQALRDVYESKGTEEYSEKVNSVHKSIIQLKGKSNVLERTIEENRLTMLDIENGLKNEIIVTAEGLQANIDKEVKRATGEEESLSTKIDVTAEGLQLNIDKEVERAEGVEEELSTSIIALAGKIVLKVDANGDIAQVKLEADPSTGTVFQVKAKNISMTAEETISFMAGGDLDLKGKNITISSDNFGVDKNGNVKCKNINAFSITGPAVEQFSNAVDDSDAMAAAYTAIAAAKKAGDDAQTAINSTNTTVNNLNNTIIPQINTWINQLSTQIKELGKPGIS